jgi:hypothetical protein
MFSTVVEKVKFRLLVLLKEPTRLPSRPAVPLETVCFFCYGSARIPQWAEGVMKFLKLFGPVFTMPYGELTETRRDPFVAIGSPAQV